MSHIRPLALCVFRHHDALLVVEHFDATRQLKFYRPVGGGIEFGERAIDAIVREVREELNTEIHNVRYLYTLENIFVHHGQGGHEIVMLFQAEFVNRALYEQPVLAGNENGSAYQAVWKNLNEFHPDTAPLYPNGLWERLKQV